MGNPYCEIGILFFCFCFCFCFEYVFSSLFLPFFLYKTLVVRSDKGGEKLFGGEGREEGE